MLDSELLKVLCCPETFQELGVADPPLLEQLNRQIQAGTLKSRAGRAVTEPLEAGLVRADRKWVYPVRRGIPVLLIDEALPMPG